MRRALSTLFASLIAAGCGGDDAGPSDSAAGDATAPDDLIPWLARGAPDIAPPQLGPCADGWREVADGDVTHCEPWPEGGPVDCGRGEVHLPGSNGCEPIGTACPTGDWADDLPTDRPITYVLASAGAGGDGSRTAPHASPAGFSLGSLPTGAVIALGRGRYEGIVRLPAVTLWGACVAETELFSNEPEADAGVINVAEGGAGIRNLRVGASERLGIVATGVGRDFTAFGVEVAGARREALRIWQNASVVAERIVARDTRFNGLGRGIEVTVGGRVELRDSAFERNPEVHVNLFMDAAALFDDVVMRAGVERPDGTFGRALGVQQADVELRHVVLEDNRDTAVSVGDAGTAASLEGSVARTTRPMAMDGTRGRGIDLFAGATLEVRRTLVEHNRDAAILAADEGSVATFEDLVVRDTQPGVGGAFGRGLALQGGVQAVVTRGRFERNREMALHADGMGTSVTLADVVVRDTQSRESDGRGGRGANVQLGAVVEMTRVLFERDTEQSLFVSAATATLTDVGMVDPRSRVLDGRFGYGIEASLGGDIDGTRVLVAGARGLGVMTSGETAVVNLADVVVRETTRNACWPDSCPDEGFGSGVGAYLGAAATLTRFRIEESSLCGVHLAEGGEVDLVDGEITGNGVGACIGDAGYDLNRLMNEVRYRDNDASIQTTTLPVPDVGDPTAGL